MGATQEVPTIYEVDFSKKQVEKRDPTAGGSKKIYSISKTKLENLKLSMSKNLFNTKYILKDEIGKIYYFIKVDEDTSFYVFDDDEIEIITQNLEE